MDASGRRRGTPICKLLLYHDLLLPFLEILDLGIASSRLRLEVHIFAWISRLQKLGLQYDPQFYKAQRNRETTFLRLEFYGGGAGDEGRLDLSQKLSSALAFVKGKFLPCMGCRMVAL
ncbi:hypothetical protein B296_00008093 [Ensete ventricosum]|uniref:Uncharacterized protein n=1 Tax=Ensete ventricosum TaxID=4639 RepID=A0A426ZTI2_ENSVE|nr:hypothetical protein B296_00008093 [Ensete ventricosum]